MHKRLIIGGFSALIVIAIVLLIFVLFPDVDELFSFLKYVLFQGLGFVIAFLALTFIYARLMWKLHGTLMTLAMGVFLMGLLVFAYSAFGLPSGLQYPTFITNYGPGIGPDLPLKNVYNFFKHFDDFERVEDIARDPTDIPAPLTHKASSTDEHKIVKLSLETKEVIGEMGPDVVFNYWTFDGKIPGPLLRVTEGDTVELTITNNPTSLHEHNIDLHAVTGPGGGAVVSKVAPGESKTFSFKALKPGLFVYHCATGNVPTHMTHGMYGMILVEPEGGLPPVDEEFYVMQGEFYSTGGLGKKGLQVFDTQAMLDGTPNYVVFNGRTGGVTGKMHAKVGDTVRIFFGNGGVNLISSFHVIGEIFDRVYPEASIGETVLTDVQTTTVPAGGAVIVEFKVDYPGNYILVDHSLARLDKGAWGVLEVTGEADDSIYKGEK